MEKKLAISMFGQKRLSREGGIEIVVEELSTRMSYEVQLRVLERKNDFRCGFVRVCAGGFDIETKKKVEGTQNEQG